jgi:trans-aconitate methyltransferase
VGIDLSNEAIGRTERWQDEKARFYCADVGSWRTDERFDAIVFNESLYYFKEPLSILDRYASYLSESGIFVISMHGLRPWNQHLWKMISAVYPTIDEVGLSNGSGKCWKIKAIARSKRQASKGKTK